MCNKEKRELLMRVNCLVTSEAQTMQNMLQVLLRFIAFVICVLYVYVTDFHCAMINCNLLYGDLKKIVFFCFPLIVDKGR